MNFITLLQDLFDVQRETMKDPEEQEEPEYMDWIDNNREQEYDD